MRITAKIEPVPLGRGRVNTKNHGCYLPARSRRFRNEIQQAAKLAMSGREMITEPVQITMHFYKRYKLTARGYGDLDNHYKAILDALNGVVFADDSQVVELHAFKHFGEPKIIIEVNEVEN